MRLSDIDKNGSRITEGQLDNPGAEDSPVASAITRRILLQRTDLLAKYGPEKVGAAVDEVADFVGDVDEIGSSDVSGWIRHVEQMLGNMDQGVAEGPGFDKWADDRVASQLHKLKPGMVQDRKTGKWYDPKKEFDKKMNSPEVMAQMKRMAQKKGVAEADDIQYHQTSGTKAGHTISSRKLSNKPQASKSYVTLQSGSMHHSGKSYNFPKGTVFTQLPSGIFAKHPSVPETHPGFGHLIRKSEDNIHAIHSALTGEQGVAEVSKATLDRYVPKAVDAHGHADFSARQSKGDPTKRSYHVDQKRTAEKRRQGISRALDRMSKVAEGTSSVNVGDDVIITGAVKYKGATGVVDSVGRDGDFIVVNLYNHGKQSFQSTDVSPNDYADSEAEESENQQRGLGESATRSALGTAVKQINQSALTEACWKGYHKEGMKTMFGKQYPNCVKNKKKTTEDYTLEEIFGHRCPHCDGELVSEELVSEKQDACYHKVKGRYKVWPSAYASGALVQCRKKGAANWGNKSESITQEEYDQLDENLKKWFSDKWVRFGPDGKIKGDCARGSSGEGKPKCLPQSKAHALGKKGRASAGARKRRQDPDADRSGKAINVNTRKKTKESADPEYNDEAGMAESNLLTMNRAVQGLLKTIEDNDNLPEWAQEKIAKAEMMLVSVWDYLQSQKEQGIDPKVSPAVAEGAKTDRMVKHITKSERASGKSSAAAEDIAWATANKHGMLDNKNKKTESTKARANNKY